MTVYGLRFPDISGRRCIFRTLADLWDEARPALEEWASNGETLTVVITAEEMDEAEVDALPDHDGW